MFDASALLGPPAFDAARWCARLAALSVQPLEAFPRWLATEGIDDARAYELLAVECILEAGAQELVRSRPREVASPASEFQKVDALIDDLMHIAHQILG